jgi:hypothetical protein
VLAVAIVLVSRPAFAYLDPGTGSYILQMVLAAVLGGLVALGVFWRRVAFFLRKLFGGREPSNGGDRTKDEEGSSGKT